MSLFSASTLFVQCSNTLTSAITLMLRGQACLCVVDYHPGKANVVVDALSRKTNSGLSLKHCTWRFEFDGALLAQLKAIPELRQMMINAQKSDAKLQ